MACHRRETLLLKPSASLILCSSLCLLLLRWGSRKTDCSLIWRCKASQKEECQGLLLEVGISETWHTAPTLFSVDWLGRRLWHEAFLSIHASAPSGRGTQRVVPPTKQQTTSWHTNLICSDAWQKRNDSISTQRVWWPKQHTSLRRHRCYVLAQLHGRAVHRRIQHAAAVRLFVRHKNARRLHLRWPVQHRHRCA